MNKLHLIVRDQFPDFVRADYPVFVDFVQAYYKWMDEQQSVGKIDNVLSVSGDLVEDYIEYIRAMVDTHGVFNDATPFNPLHLEKIKQIYTIKGSERGLANILRMVYHTDATIRYPSENVLRASDGKWYQESFITVQRILGTTPTTISTFYLSYDYTSVPVSATRFINTDDDAIRIYFRPRSNVSIAAGQIIVIKNSSGVNVFTGRVIESPASIGILSGGQGWQLGQIITIPGTTSDTIARVSGVDSSGTIQRIEIVENGYNHGENQTIIVSPYINKPTNATYELESEITSVSPLTYHYTLTLNDHVEGVTEHTTGELTGIIPALSNSTIDVQSTIIDSVPSAGVDVSIEDWLASRATLQYNYKYVVPTLGRWTDESSRISNESVRLQDNYYYQQFSYEIESDVDSRHYIRIARDLHPAGTKLFTTYALSTEIDITLVASTSFPYVNLDLLDIATTSDTATKQFGKYATDSLTISESHSYSVNKYISDTVSASSPDTSSFEVSTYDSETYFAEDYVRIEKLLTIGA